MTTASRWACPALVVLLFGSCVYRAATQSITHDEARSYFKFCTHGFRGVLTDYEAGNHVLQSLLSTASVQVLHLTEFRLRLPTLAGALLYLLAAWRLSVWLFAPGWRAALSLALLGLNPFVLDYLSAARGYGLGLGLFLWAFYEVVRCRLYRAGLCLGLAVASTVVFVFPAAALAIAVAVRERHRLWLVVDSLAGPALVVALLFLAVPLTHISQGTFYYGASSLGDSIESVVNLSWFHNEDVAFSRWLRLAVTCTVPLVLLAAAAMGIRRRGTLLLAASVLLLTVVMAIAVGVPYPLGRTAIYWAPLFALTAVLLFDALDREGWRVPAALCLVYLIGSLVLFGAGFSTAYYAEWRYDAGTKRIARIIAGQPRKSVTVGAPWQFAPSLNFYRLLYRMNWLAPVEGGAKGDFDYYVRFPGDDTRGLRILFRDPVSHQVLAVKR